MNKLYKLSVFILVLIIMLFIALFFRYKREVTFSFESRVPTIVVIDRWTGNVYLQIYNNKHSNEIIKENFRWFNVKVDKYSSNNY